MREKNKKVIIKVKISWYKLVIFINNGDKFKISVSSNVPLTKL